MNDVTRTRRLAVAAIVAIIAAGAVLQKRDAEPDPRASTARNSEPARTPTVPSPALARTPRVGEQVAIGPAGLRAAEAYAAAATSWSARTYRGAYRTRLRLAAPALRRQLLQRRPTRDQLEQLVADNESRLSAVVKSQTLHATAESARVLVGVDELDLTAGRRTQQTVTYRVDLKRRDGAWRVAAFGPIGASS